MKALLIDDHAIVRRGVKQLLEGIADEVSEAVDAEAALDACKRARFDLLVLDVNMPGLAGLELLTLLLRDQADLRVLVLTMHADPVYAKSALAAGALGFVSKAADPEELLVALRRVAAGRRYVEAEIAQQMVLQDPRPDLSRRELDIVKLIVQGRTLDQVATSVGLSYKTVANMCTTIKTKLGAAHLGDLVRKAIDLGLA